MSTIGKDLANAIRDALLEIDRCPGDSIVDIFNEQLDSWQTGLKMDQHYYIEKKDLG